MYRKMKTEKITDKNKNITHDMLLDTLKYIALNYLFSTFPYIIGEIGRAHV